jgi:hypothetical protein
LGLRFDDQSVPPVPHPFDDEIEPPPPPLDMEQEGAVIGEGIDAHDSSGHRAGSREWLGRGKK